MTNDVPRGLAGRWVGLHALAFAIDNLLTLCIWSAVRTVGDVHAFNRSATGILLAHGLRGLFVAGAQVVALSGSAFPTSRRSWFVWTAGGVVTGSWMSVVAMEPAFRLLAAPFLRSAPAVRDSACYSVWAVVFLTQGILLGAAQAIPLRRTDRSRALIWAASATGGWMLGEAGAYALGQGVQALLAVPPGEWPLVLDGTAWVGSVLSGLLFAVVQLPALRRLLAPRSP